MFNWLRRWLGLAQPVYGMDITDDLTCPYNRIVMAEMMNSNGEYAVSANIDNTGNLHLKFLPGRPTKVVTRAEVVKVLETMNKEKEDGRPE